MSHSCPLPQPKKKYVHSLWICDCGKAYRSVFKFTYVNDYYEWVEWPNET